MSDARSKQRSYWDALADSDPDAAVIDPNDKRGLKNRYLAEVRDLAFLQTLAARNVVSGVLLDVGTGTGSAALPLLDAGYRVLGVDISFGLLRHAQERCGAGNGLFALTDGRELPVKAQSFDAAIVYVVLSYLVDDATALALLANIRTALKPGAALVMIEQVRANRRICEDGLKVQRTISEWRRLLDKAGFSSSTFAILRHGRFPGTPLIKAGLIPPRFWPLMRGIEAWVGRCFGVLKWDYAEVKFVAVAP